VDERDWGSAKLITIGHLAKMYNQLPSTVLRDATTFDIMVMDVYTTWEKHKMDPSDGSQYEQSQLEEMMRGVRG
jgi:hypothetical protein